MTNHERFIKTPAKVLIERFPNWKLLFCTLIGNERTPCERTFNPVMCTKCVISWLKATDSKGISNHRRLVAMSTEELAHEISVAGCILIPLDKELCAGEDDNSRCDRCIYNWLNEEETK